MCMKSNCPEMPPAPGFHSARALSTRLPYKACIPYNTSSCQSDIFTHLKYSMFKGFFQYFFSFFLLFQHFKSPRQCIFVHYAQAYLKCLFHNHITALNELRHTLGREWTVAQHCQVVNMSAEGFSVLA